MSLCGLVDFAFVIQNSRYYTDRRGLPVCIDITGKEGKVKMTDNANFFCIGPSGSGKSFHMEFRRSKRRQTAAKIGVIII